MERDFESFFKMHENRIYFQMHRLRIPHTLFEAFYSEGVLALWKAYQTFDSAKGNVGTYLNYQIRHRMIDLQRTTIRDQEVVALANKEMETEISSGNRCKRTDQLLPYYEDIKVPDSAFWEEVRRWLTHNQWKWVAYFIIAELSIQEIMEIEDVSAAAVKSWGQQVRKKLRNPDIIRTLHALK